MVKEFVDFLGAQPPYDALDAAELERLAHAVEVEFFAAGTTVLRPGDPVLRHVWVVRTGTVQIADGDRVLDELGVGDTFGHVSAMSGEPPSHTAVAATDCLCYRLPDPRTLLDHPERLRYAPYGSRPRGGPVVPGAGGGLGDRAWLPVSRYLRPVVQCPADTPVREVALLIERERQSCALIGFPDGVGIVTDADFRRRVASGEVG